MQEADPAVPDDRLQVAEEKDPGESLENDTAPVGATVLLVTLAVHDAAWPTRTDPGEHDRLVLVEAGVTETVAEPALAP